jgi:hypothetical protein
VFSYSSVSLVFISFCNSKFFLLKPIGYIFEKYNKDGDTFDRVSKLNKVPVYSKSKWSSEVFSN